MECVVQAVGVLGPGLNGWPVTRAILSGTERHRMQATVKPVPDILPATERRRSSEAARLAIAVAQEALRAADVSCQEVTTVFASSDGDGEITHKICESLAGPDRDVSPTLFHNSVYNAPAGYWSIATNSRAGSTSLCAYDVSFAAGLLEAAVQVVVDRKPVMMVTSDLPSPGPVQEVRPVEHSFATALLLVPSASDSSLARWRITIEPYRPATNHPTAIDERVCSNPASRCLPLLAALAAGTPQTIWLDYLDGSSLVVACEV